MEVVAVISSFTWERGTRINSALCVDPFISFVCISAKKILILTDITAITTILHNLCSSRKIDNWNFFFWGGGGGGKGVVWVRPKF